MSYEITWEGILAEFKKYNPYISDKIVDWYPSGQMEITVKLSDGMKIAYDYISKSCHYIDGDCEIAYELDEDLYIDELARRIRKKLRLRGMSQEDLAAEANISRVSLSRYMNGRAMPSVYIVAKLARALRCSLTDLADFR